MRTSERPSGQVWDLLEQWRQAHPLKPNQTQMARLLGVSKSLISSWKYMESMMQTDDMKQVSKQTDIAFDDLARAAAADAEKVVEHLAHRRMQSKGKAEAAEAGGRDHSSQDPGGMEPA